MRKVTLTESDLKRIIHRILEQNETPSNEGDMDQVSMKATTDHIMQVYRSLLDDIDYVKTERDKTQNSNLTQKDKDFLVGAWNRVLEVIHEDTRPPSQEEDQDY
jgi:hypothetical protein